MRERSLDDKQPKESQRDAAEPRPQKLSKRRPMDTLSEENPLICRGID